MERNSDNRSDIFGSRELNHFNILFYKERRKGNSRRFSNNFKSKRKLTLVVLGKGMSRILESFKVFNSIFTFLLFKVDNEPNTKGNF